LDVTDFDFTYDLLESLTQSSQTFLDCVQGNWDRVVHAAFVFQLQPVNPDLPSCVIYAQPAPDGTSRDAQVSLLKNLEILCGRCRVTIGAFVTDGDSGYDQVHEIQGRQDVEAFERTRKIPCTQKDRAISDVLHLLKRARYRMLKSPSMVVGISAETKELNLPELKRLLIGDLPAVVLCDEPITKMHDSLPMVLFRFETLVKLQENHILGWMAYFIPWVILNEAMSQKGAATPDRLGWFRLADYYLMKCIITYRHQPHEAGVAQFGRSSSPVPTPGHCLMRNSFCMRRIRLPELYMRYTPHAGRFSFKGLQLDPSKICLKSRDWM
jgi:hypothetical protein